MYDFLVESNEMKISKSQGQQVNYSKKSKVKVEQILFFMHYDSLLQLKDKSHNKYFIKLF